MTEEQVTEIFPGASEEQVSGFLQLYQTGERERSEHLQQLTEERDTLQAQLKTATETIDTYRELDFDGMKQQAADWEQKYNRDTEALQKQLSALRYEQAAQRELQTLQFTSASARRAFLRDLEDQGLEVADGRLTGFADFLAQYREADPDAFQTEAQAGAGAPGAAPGGPDGSGGAARPAPSFSQHGSTGSYPAGAISAAALAAKNYSARFNRS